MTDAEHAAAIRAAMEALNAASQAAFEAGITVILSGDDGREIVEPLNVDIRRTTEL